MERALLLHLYYAPPCVGALRPNTHIHRPPKPCFAPPTSAASPLRLCLPPRFHFPPHRHLPSLLLLASLPLSPRCPRHTRLSFACISSGAVLAGAGGSGRGLGGGAGGGGGGPGGGDGFAARASGAQALGEEPDDVPLSTSSDNVILLDVRDMSCGGCASSVKKILESQPHVILASVNLATETAVVKVSLGPELLQGTEIAKKDIGEALAKHLTSCGFKSSLREGPIGG